MAKFLTTHATAFYIEEVIRNAHTKLVLITPYLQVSRTLAGRLRDAARRGVAISIVYGKSELKNSEWEKLSDLENLSLHFLENLHAKCYLNETLVVIGSMNMYEFSEKNNREMSVLLTHRDDEEAFADALREVESILAAAEIRSLRRSAVEVGTQTREWRGQAVFKEGYCIRCRVTLSYDPYKPLCDNCFDIWLEWRNDEYQEKYCHRCGHNYATCKAVPVCRPCFQENPPQESPFGLIWE